MQSATMLSFMQLTVVSGLTCLILMRELYKFRYKLHQTNPKESERCGKGMKRRFSGSIVIAHGRTCVQEAAVLTRSNQTSPCFLSRFPSCGQHLEQAACSSAVIVKKNPYSSSCNVHDSCHLYIYIYIILYRLLRVTPWYHFWDAKICQPRDKVCPENCVAPALENTPGHTRPRPLSPL